MYQKILRRFPEDEPFKHQSKKTKLKILKCALLKKFVNHCFPSNFETKRDIEKNSNGFELYEKRYICGKIGES